MNEDKEFEDVYRLLTEVVPERRDEIAELLGRYAIGFRRKADDPGFTLANTYGQVVYNDRTMRQLYLLSFMTWRALRAYSGVILQGIVRRQPFDLVAISGLPSQEGADQAIDRLARTLADIGDAWGIDDVPWPEDIPKPPLDKHAGVEDQAAQEVSLFAITFMLLHEIQHVILQHEQCEPGEWAEELLCDAFAQDFMLARVDQYAAQKEFPAEKILKKRAIGIALANAVFVEITPPESWSGSNSHPPIANRLMANYEGWPENDFDPWIYMACLVAARLRRAGRTTGAIVFDSPRDLCKRLTRLLT